MRTIFYYLGLGIMVVSVVLTIPSAILAEIANLFFGLAYKGYNTDGDD